MPVPTRVYLSLYIVAIWATNVVWGLSTPAMHVTLGLLAVGWFLWLWGAPSVQPAGVAMVPSSLVVGGFQYGIRIHVPGFSTLNWWMDLLCLLLVAYFLVRWAFRTNSKYGQGDGWGFFYIVALLSPWALVTLGHPHWTLVEAAMFTGFGSIWDARLRKRLRKGS